MKLAKNRSTMLIALMSVSVFASCGKKKESSTTATETPESVADLKLSSALNLAIPDDLAAAAGGTSASLTLTGANLVGKKSSEACRTMENVNRVFENLQSIGGMFCHLEVESDKMKFGTKYNVDISGDPGLAESGKSMSIWVDNSNTAELKVYMCEDGALREKIVISGFGGEGKAKGSMTHKYSHSEGGSTQTGGINMEFDFTQSGYKIVKAKMKHSSDGGMHSGTFRNFADIKLADSGVSTVLLSSEGSRGSDTFSDQAAVLFNGTMGQSLFSGNGTYSSNSYNWTSRSTFNKDGITIAKSEATSDIVVDKAILPVKLASDFSPDAPDGWDCSGATETIAIDMTDPVKKAAHGACNQDHNREFTSCWGEAFEQGEQE